MFRINKNSTNKMDLYELFLDSIADKSSIRLRSTDMSFQLLKTKFREAGYEVTETNCIGPTFIIKRNQNGRI